MIEPGETVVVDGQYKLQPGAKILTGPPPGKGGGKGPGGKGEKKGEAAGPPGGEARDKKGKPKSAE